MVGETPKPIRALSWFDELTTSGTSSPRTGLAHHERDELTTDGTSSPRTGRAHHERNEPTPFVLPGELGATSRAHVMRPCRSLSKDLGSGSLPNSRIRTETKN